MSLALRLSGIRAHRAFSLRYVLPAIALLYLIVYFAMGVTPGNSPGVHPMGWWGWWDQGQYLKSANAFARLDLTAGNHNYPPLYPALGSLFVHWSSGHPFVAINLAGLLWFCFVFIRFSDLYFSRWVSVGLLIGTTLFNPRIFENYVIPWTTTLGAALLATAILALVWLREVEMGTRDRITSAQIFLVALCLGLILPTRPADAVVAAVVGLGLLVAYFKVNARFPAATPGMGRALLVATVGAAVGPLVLFGFNLSTFGSLAGGYMQMASGHGFPLSDLPEKFVSLWLDGSTLYGEPKAALTQRQPWLFFGLAGLVFTWFRGDLLTRTIGAAITVLFLIYLPFGDLLPNSLWRFRNIHYFKWTFPFFALMALLLLRECVVDLRRRRWFALPVLLAVGIPAILLSLHLRLDMAAEGTPVSFDGKQLNLDLQGEPVDFIDFMGLTGDFTAVYLGEQRATLDGRELRWVADYRVVPMAHGVRMVFIRPVRGVHLTFSPHPNVKVQAGQLQARTGQYQFVLGMPRPFRSVKSLEPALP